MVTLAAWLHTLDPFLFRISGDFGVRWYGLAYLAGFAVAYLVLRGLARRKLVLIPPERAGDVMMWLIGGTLLGGRLGYALFYQPALFTMWLDHPPYWGILAINEGGMASHGGMLGVILASWRISRGWKGQTGAARGRSPLPHVLDILAVLSPFGLFFGRIANFINGELLGAVVAPPGKEGPWWSVQFPQELLTRHAPTLSPEQESALAALAQTAAPGRSFEAGLVRVVESAATYAPQLKPLLASRYPSQLFQAAAEGLVLGIAVWAIWAFPRRPGVVAAWWLIVYGILRVITEIWRLPDAQFADGRPGGLSRGQWLSMAMVACGIGLLFWWMRQPAPRLGGWWKQESGAKPAEPTTKPT